MRREVLAGTMLRPWCMGELGGTCWTGPNHSLPCPHAHPKPCFARPQTAVEYLLGVIPPPMHLHVRRWSELSQESISLEAIRKLHAPPSHFRVSPYRYPAGTAFPGSARAGRIYVLSGQCSFIVGDWRAELAPATYADSPSGGFEFQVLGDDAVELVRAWELPELFHAKNAA